MNEYQIKVSLNRSAKLPAVCRASEREAERKKERRGENERERESQRGGRRKKEGAREQGKLIIIMKGGRNGKAGGAVDNADVL